LTDVPALHPSLLLLALGLSACLPALSQSQVFRCGNEYTNDAQRAQQLGCTTLDIGPITVVPGTKVVRSEAAVSPARPAQAGAEPRGVQRVDAAEQRARDSDARLILGAELRKAEARLAQLQAEYNQGEPEKQGIEGRNHQRYLDRVQSIKESLVRQQSDIASLKRELSRLPAGSAVATNP
jgi:hypothetical protein